MHLRLISQSTHKDWLMSANRKWNGICPVRSKIFIAPFKGIITHENAIRGAFRKRTAECESEESEKARKSVDPPSTEGSDQSDAQPLDAVSAPSKSIFHPSVT
jgi:hypothetical protein